MQHVEYVGSYDDYWSRPDRIGSSSTDLAQFARRASDICGSGRALDIGCGEGWLVGELLSLGIESYGVDVSPIVVERANARFPGRFYASSVLDMPFDDNHFETIVSTDCLEHIAPEDIAAALKEIHRVCRKYTFLQIATTMDRDNHWHLTVEGREWWEIQFFRAGFRKHPAYYNVNEYNKLNKDAWQICLVLEKVPSDLEDSSLHQIDPSRQTGLASDRSLFPYQWAKEFVRPGDRALHISVGLGFGPYAVYEETELRESVALTSSVDYCQSHFGRHNSPIKFLADNQQEFLARSRSGEFDLITNFSAFSLETGADILQEYYRVISPGGRILLSIASGVGVDAAGQIGLLEAIIPEGLMLEIVSAQDHFVEHADGLVEIRSLRAISLPLEFEFQSYSLLVSLMKNPHHNDTEYREGVHGYSSPPANLLEFARDYNNPWLHRALISPTLRAKSKALLMHIADETLRHSHDNASPDVGAALAVIGYRLLETQDIRAEAVGEFIETISRFLSYPPKNPHMQRWGISLTYLNGKLLQKIGQIEQAISWLKQVVEMPFSGFSPLIATKILNAAYEVGVHHATRGDVVKGRQYWSRGVDIAFAAISVSQIEIIGNQDEPHDFAIYELIEILDVAAQCCICLRRTRHETDRSAYHIARSTHTSWKRLLREHRELISLADQRLIETERVGEERDELYNIAEARLNDLKRLGRDRQDLFDAAEARLAEVNRLGQENRELFDVAEERLAEVQRLGNDRQALLDIAEERLAEIQRLGNDRQSLLDVAEERLAEVQRLGNDRQALFDVAEERLAEVQRLGNDRQALLDIAEERLAEIRRLGNDRQSLLDIAEERLAEVHRLGNDRQALFDVAEERLAEIQRLGSDRQALFDVAEERLAEVSRLGQENRQLFGLAEERLAEIQRLGNDRQSLLDIAEERLAEVQRLAREGEELSEIAELRLAHCDRLEREQVELLQIAGARADEISLMSATIARLTAKVEDLQSTLEATDADKQHALAFIERLNSSLWGKTYARFREKWSAR